MTVSVSAASVVETDASSLIYTVTREDTTSALDVNVTWGGAAALGTDYTQSGVTISGGNSGTVHFDVGGASVMVTVTPMNDTVVETDEAVSLTINSGSGYSIGTPGLASALISNNDTAVLSISDVSVSESGVFTFTITSSNPTDTNITGTIDTADIALEAVAGMDYTAIAGATFTITGDSADLTDTVTVIVSDDNIVEDNEDFNVNLSAALFGGAPDSTRATFTGGDASGLGTIEHNDTAVLSIDNVSLAENGTFTFTITSSNPTETDITGTIDTANIAMEALAGSDYTAIVGGSFTITGDSMDLSDTETVTVNDDNIVEDDETFNVNLSAALFGGGGWGRS